MTVQVPPGVVGAALQAHVDLCAARIRDALGILPSIRQLTAEHAPAGWAEYFAPKAGSPVDLLFLDGIEADGDGQLSFVFDFGDLDELVTHLDDQGNSAEVSLRS